MAKNPAPAHIIKLWNAFREARGDRPFRRQDVAELFYPNLRPRKMASAIVLADTLMAAARSAGELVKAGHVAWKFNVKTERTLLSGRTVAELPEVKSITLTTRCPAKWVVVDLETGHVWSGAGSTMWTNASVAERDEAAAILKPGRKKQPVREAQAA